MAQGIAACGDHPIILSEKYYQPSDIREVDACVFYGLEGNTPRLFQDFRATKTAIYVDLGYWGRREGGRWAGYHKVVVNDRHPTKYFSTPHKPPDRFAKFHVKHMHWPLYGNRWSRPTDAPILLAGMGDKGAAAEGCEPEAWEREIIARIRQHTRRPILYRPKPSWKGAKPIEGCGFSPRTVEIEQELARAWCVVTHHSNVAVDAITRAIPAFCESGVASRMALHIEELPRIEDVFALYRLSKGEVEQWAADLAYTQWNIAEMKQGLPWQHLKDEGLIKLDTQEG